MKQGIMRVFREAGFTEARMEEIFAEAAGMTGQQLVDFLGQIASGAMAIKEAAEATDLDEMYRLMDLSALDSFGEGMTDVFSQIDLLQARMITSVSAADQANAAERIADLIMNARQAEIQMLQQIQQIQDGINSTIASSIESLRLGEMSMYERQLYFDTTVADLVGQLSSEMDPAEVGEAFSDIQGYIQNMIGTFDEDQLKGTLAALDPMGTGQTANQIFGDLDEALGIDLDLDETVSQFFIRVYEALQGKTDPLLEEDRAEVEGWADRLNEEANRTADALMMLGDAAHFVIYGTDRFRDYGRVDEPTGTDDYISSGPSVPITLPGMANPGDVMSDMDMALVAIEAAMKNSRFNTGDIMTEVTPRQAPVNDLVSDNIVVNVETNPCINISGEIAPLLRIIDSRAPYAEDTNSAWS